MLRVIIDEVSDQPRHLGGVCFPAFHLQPTLDQASCAGSDQIARGVYEALRQANLDIPGDVSVAGFNDTEGALFDPPLTSVREFPEQLGQHLAEFSMRALKDPLGPRNQMTIPTKLVVRQSTAAPRKDAK